MIAALAVCPMLASAGDPQRPFPQAGKLTYHGIKPNNHSQKELNTSVKKFYKYWKNKYLIESENVPGDYKIAYNKRKETVSEAMGYGMLIVVQIAGYDPKAKEYFDGLNRFRKRYPSIVNEAFMCWKVNEAKPKKDDSATDGDIDIATALLMAAQQWNDKTYLEEAKVIIKNIGKDLVRKDSSLRLGDWNVEGEEHNGTRPSDFTTAHFRAFYEATRNPLWQNVEGECYEILDHLQTNYSPHAGLVPDFAVWDSKGKWKPAPADFLEGKDDGNYSYNSCRVPWRIGLSAVYHDDPRAKKILSGMMTWVVKTHPNPKTFKAGYNLDGKAVVKYEELAFTAPLVVAMMSTQNQKWLDVGFDSIRRQHADYFSDTINMLSLLTLTGNYWLPKYDLNAGIKK